jgi:hypothetical protein
MIHTEKMSLKRPPIPPEWYLPSLIGLVAYVTYALALYTVPALFARAVLLMPLPLPVAIILMILLIWLAAQGMLLFSWLGHEGFHLSLHRLLALSPTWSVFFSCPEWCNHGSGSCVALIFVSGFTPTELRFSPAI